jgi:cytosine/adenosine deaminase-related metal-dependent hydrolase
VTTRSVVLDHAHVVAHDSVVARSIAFTNARVAATPADDALHLDLRDHFVLPGLINAHDHLQLNAIPPLAHSEPFANSYAWIDAFETYRRDPSVVAAVAVPEATRLRHGGLKNLLCGATTVAHHDPWKMVFARDFPVKVVHSYGWSHSLELGAVRDGSSTRYGPPVRESFLATPSDIPWIIHLAEGTDDVAQAELARLDAMGCLNANTIIVHGAGLSDADVDRVIERGAHVVWCPSSNLGMLGRTLDPRRLANAGRLALGTDSRLTGSRDLLSELQVAAGNSDLQPRELFRIVTADAHQALRLPGAPGLTLGGSATCLIIQATGDPYEALLATTRSELRAVVHEGVPLLADVDFAPWFEHAGVDSRVVHLDGRAKLMAASLARPEVIALEPGLEAAHASLVGTDDCA